VTIATRRRKQWSAAEKIGKKKFETLIQAGTGGPKVQDVVNNVAITLARIPNLPAPAGDDADDVAMWSKFAASSATALRVNFVVTEGQEETSIFFGGWCSSYYASLQSFCNSYGCSSSTFFGGWSIRFFFLQPHGNAIWWLAATTILCSSAASIQSKRSVPASKRSALPSKFLLLFLLFLLFF